MAAPYVTTTGRLVAGMFVGALVGGFLTALPMTGPFSQGAAFSNGFGTLAGYVFVSFIICTLMWFMGIAVFGLPLWGLVGRLKVRQGWEAALVCGALFPPIWLALLFAVMECLDSARLGVGFRSSSILDPAMGLVSAMMAAIGCVVGLAMWRLAYRRIPTGDMADAPHRGRYTRRGGVRGTHR